jgi:hypothetical protein
VYVADTYNNKIEELTSGSTDWTDITWNGSFYLPEGIAVDGSGSVYVADTEDNRIMELKHAGFKIPGLIIIPKTIPGLNQGLNPQGAAKLAVSAPATAVSGVAFSFTVTAQTLLNTTATGYTGTVSFTSDDQKASLPPFRTLTNGTGAFSAIMRTAGVGF